MKGSDIRGLERGAIHVAEKAVTGVSEEQRRRHWESLLGFPLGGKLPGPDWGLETDFGKA